MPFSPAAELLAQLVAILRDKGVDGVFGSRRPRPYMKMKERCIIEELLQNLRPARCLEWGSGYSTLYFSRLLPEGATWLAIEHEKEWADKVSGMDHGPNVKVVHVAPNNTPWTDGHGDGSAADLRDYIDYPAGSGHFDLILVDGRARVACLEKAAGLVTPSGVVLLHDANREYYRGALPSQWHQALFLDERKDEGGLWVGSPGRELNSVLAVMGHQAVWRGYERLCYMHLGRILD
jgi:predicted O-methyltransferase YrrM